MDILSALLQNDENYLKKLERVSEFAKAYNDLPLTDEQRKVVNTYIAYLESAYERKCRLSYFAGMLDEETNRFK